MPVAIVNEFVDGDIYRWGSLMAGALVGSLPLVVLYELSILLSVAFGRSSAEGADRLASAEGS